MVHEKIEWISPYIRFAAAGLCRKVSLRCFLMCNRQLDYPVFVAAFEWAGGGKTNQTVGCPHCGQCNDRRRRGGGIVTDDSRDQRGKHFSDGLYFPSSQRMPSGFKASCTYALDLLSQTKFR